MGKTDFCIKNRVGSLIVVSGASGSGKSTICKLLRERDIIPVTIIVTCTTRKPRDGEIDGIDYHFLTRAEFENMIADGGFLEYANVYGNLYGTPIISVEESLKEGKNVILVIDVQGANTIRDKLETDAFFKKCTEFVFILPPSMNVLEERLRGRGTDSNEVINRRLLEANKEMACLKLYDYFVINDTLDDAVNSLGEIIKSFRMKVKRLK